MKRWASSGGGLVEVRMRAAAADGDDVREGHLEQPSSPRVVPKPLAFTPPKGMRGSAVGNDEVVDEDEAGLELRGERAGLRDVAGEDGSAEGEVGGVDEGDGCGFVVGHAFDRENAARAAPRRMRSVSSDGLRRR